MSGSHARMIEAARWDARLRSPDCAAADRAAFSAWHAVPANAAAMERLRAGLALFREDRAHAARARALHPVRRWTHPLAATAIGLAAVGLAVYRPASPPDRLYVAAAAARPLRLADASVVEMGRGSALRIRYGGGVRHVTLLGGQARFRVEPDPARPFVVEVADRRVTATGTLFGVGLAGNHVLVRLHEGSARVHCWHGLLPSTMTLRAGQRLDAVIGSDHATVSTDAWRS